MGQLTTALMIVIGINIMLVLGQMSASNLNPSFTGKDFCNNNPIGRFGNCTGNSYSYDASNPQSNLPTTSTSVDATTGNVFTDTWNSFKVWFSDTVGEWSGLNYIINILGAPKSFLIGIGLPSDFSNLVSVLWYAITLWLMVAFLRGDTNV